MLTPTRKVLKRYYRCDSVFHVDLVQDLFLPTCQQRIFGLVWCGKSDQVELFHFFESGELCRIQAHSAYLKNAHKKGGQSQKRFERITEQQRTGHFKEVAQHIYSVFRDPIVECVFVAGSIAKQQELKEHLTTFSCAPIEMVTINDNVTPVNLIKTLHLEKISKIDQVLEEFYSSLHENKVTYGKHQSKEALTGGQLKYYFSQDVEDEKLCQEYGTTFFWISGQTDIQSKFLREFGACGGITRYVLSEFSFMNEEM